MLATKQKHLLRPLSYEMKLQSGLIISLNDCNYALSIGVGIVSVFLLRHSGYEPTFTDCDIFNYELK